MQSTTKLGCRINVKLICGATPASIRHASVTVRMHFAAFFTPLYLNISIPEGEF